MCSFVQARKDNNRIWGYVTTGSNSDGRASIPITSPSFEMQKSLIEATVRKSGLEPHQVQYVEMHGRKFQLNISLLSVVFIHYRNIFSVYSIMQKYCCSLLQVHSLMLHNLFWRIVPKSITFIALQCFFTRYWYSSR